MNVGCPCTKWNGQSCSLQFSKEYVKEYRFSSMELTTSDLDLVIMVQLKACTNSSSFVATDSRHEHHKRSYTNFLHQGKPICMVMFRFLHTSGDKKMRNISKALMFGGIAPRVHGNTRKLPKNTLTLAVVQDVIRFLLYYCEQHALLLPGRVPGYSRTDIKLLPSSKSKKGIWYIYREAEEQGTHTVAYSTFNKIWKSQLPYVVLMKPMTDLCWKCQQNSNAIVQAANSSETAKSATVDEALEHLRIVQIERS